MSRTRGFTACARHEGYRSWCSECRIATADLLPDTPFQRLLVSYGACLSARIWVGDKTLRQAWASAIDEPDVDDEGNVHYSTACASWMYWLIQNTSPERDFTSEMLGELESAEDEHDCAKVRALVPYGVIGEACGGIE